MHCNLKKQLKVQYIGSFEEIDSFYWPKMHFLIEGQKIRAWVDPPTPPLSQAMPERKRFFSIDAFPKMGPFTPILPLVLSSSISSTFGKLMIIPQQSYDHHITILW